MQKVNSNHIEEISVASPGGKFGRSRKAISEALGRDPFSMDLLKRHPFDVDIVRIPPGKSLCPYHSHSEQWEFYLVLAGTGQVRHQDGATPAGPGDAFVFKPGEAHQMTNDGQEDWVFYVIADNPIGDSCHYPDSGKWLVRSPERRIIRSADLDYFDGEE